MSSKFYGGYVPFLCPRDVLNYANLECVVVNVRHTAVTTAKSGHQEGRPSPCLGNAHSGAQRSIRVQDVTLM